MVRILGISVFITAAVLVGAYTYGGPESFALAAILAVPGLAFDNADAAVLPRISSR